MRTTSVELMPVEFDIYYDGELWCARGMGVNIFTQGKTPDEVVKNIKDAAELHFGIGKGTLDSIVAKVPGPYIPQTFRFDCP